jgi:hypothetical protein
VYAQKDFKILSETKTSLVVEYIPVYLNSSFESFNTSEYFSVELLNGIIENSSSFGMPKLITRKFDIAVPSEVGNNIQILSSEYKTVSGKLLPVSNYNYIDKMLVPEIQESPEYNSFANKEIVTFGEFGFVRDLKIQTINVHPVQFDVNQNKIKLYKRIVFKISFNTGSKFIKIRDSELLNNVVLNSGMINKFGSEQKTLKKAVANSVLANGDWYRFEAKEEGIYKIDKTYLTKLGISINSIDPRTIKIYNNGGYILPWSINGERPNDLVENAIFISGENDGKFDDNDYILFYGRGVDFFEYNNRQGTIKRNKHWYSKHNYYWLTFGGSNGKRMQQQNNVNGQATYKQTSTVAFKFYDDDKENLLGSGLINVGDNFSNSKTSNTYTNMLNELVADSTIDYSFHFVNGSQPSIKLALYENNTKIFSRSVSGIGFDDNAKYKAGRDLYATAEYQGILADNRSVLKFTITPSAIGDKGYLDYYELRYYQKLTAVDNSLIFFSDGEEAVTEYKVNGFSGSDIYVFNISDFSNIKIVETEKTGGQISFNANESNNAQIKYIALHSSKFKIPTTGEKIENSNIRGISPGAKYLIIAHKKFQEQAERLLNYRKNEARFKISGQLVFINDIYNEFSGGLLDPTAIRDFLKYAYDNWEIKPEYVLLFGDGDYDYYDLLGKGLNFVPTFQTKQSLSELNSYPFDDFYTRISGNDDKADLAIGRLNVTTTDEAKSVVDKIITYEAHLNKGLWRNKITLLADDGLTSKGNDYARHTGQSEQLSKYHIPQNFQRNKIYLSNYKTVNTGLGRRKPDVNKAILDAINNGTLIFNYIGHGNPDVWAHERVFQRSVSIPQLKNKEFFFLTAATCDFGKYDDPNLQSATEEMILMEDAGMIGGLSAVRPVYSNANAALNNLFYDYLLGSKDPNGFPVPVGNAYFRLKQNKTSENDEKYHLFGDPYLRLDIPNLPAKIEQVNNSNLDQPVQIKALSNVLIKGKVFGTDSNNSSFDGEGIVTVFDSKRIIHLDDINYDMEVQDGVIFRGRVSIENGSFATSFTVPKDISYENKNGKIVVYFFNDDIDGVGYTNNIIVGGTDTSKSNDGKGPEIEILYDDDEMENSYLVGPNFKLHVKLFDETGLNTTGTGIGHKLEAVLNDDEEHSIDLTNYFIGDLNSGGRKGEVNYKFSSLEKDDYKIKIKAWDVYNNFSSQESFFTVVDDSKLIVREVYNYPNPFSSYTYFTFQHNLNDAINVKIKIYTIAGRLIKEIEEENIVDKFVKIKWNGKDKDNDIIANGTYLYKLNIETADGKYKDNILGKIAVIR